MLCQGSYLGLAPLAARLLPPLQLTFTAQTVALLQVEVGEAERLTGLPSMVTQFHPTRYTYILPPITYPDGKTYLKFGQVNMLDIYNIYIEVACEDYSLLVCIFIKFFV